MAGRGDAQAGRSLADALDGLSDSEWEQPSLCGAWSNHQVAAHLNAPFAVPKLTFVVAIAKARGISCHSNLGGGICKVMLDAL